MKKLKIYNNGVLAGFLEEIPGVGYLFEYEDKYFLDPVAPAISLTISKS